ncbi:reverse transcriptase domain-containing protein [Trichonephila clavipes]|nr:reverse transcriptase domain-containing protein [Trichonephila clavipes]
MSEDLSKFKKKRTAVRSSLTKLINKIEGKINNENEPVDQFEAFIEQLNDKESNLSLLNTLIEDRLSVDTITEDMEASEEIKEKVIFWKTKLSSKIRRINSDSIQVDTVSRNIQVIDSNSFEYRFGNKNMLINAHLSNLLNLTPVRNSTDIVGLRNLYDRAETQIRSLESLGVKGESYSNLLTPILLKQMPSELVLDFNRSQKDEGFDLSALLQFLHLEIRSRERASQINNHKLCHYSPPPQDRTKNKRLLFRRTTDDPNLCIEIEAVETEHISITNLPTSDRNIDKKFRYLKNVQLADPYEFNDKEISILIGADYYYQVVTGRITRLNKNLVTVETLFGWSLQGQSTDSEDILTMSVIVNESNISKQLSEFWDLENSGIEKHRGV